MSSGRSITSILMDCEAITQTINKLVELQRLPSAGQYLDSLGLTFVDINRTINLLSDYDKILEALLKTSRVDWPPDLNKLNEEVDLWSS